MIKFRLNHLVRFDLYLRLALVIISALFVNGFAIANDETEQKANVTEVLPSLSDKQIFLRAKAKEGANKSSKTLIIESQVSGSQEQPKVIYIMPWQGINEAITLDDRPNKLDMPKLHLINPKQFKHQTRALYNK